MRVKHGNIELDAWQISLSDERPDWIAHAFEVGLLKPYAADKFALAGHWIPNIVAVGDYITSDNGDLRAVPAKRFEREYTII